MRRRRVLDWVLPALAACCGGWFGLGCLPADTRDPPAEVLVTAEADDALLHGVDSAATRDGWRVAYGSFLVSIGAVTLDQGTQTCDVYDSGGYNRLLDLLVFGPQKVNLRYALGACKIGWSLSHPGSLVALGKGVTEADRALLDDNGRDAYQLGHGISLWVEGRAERGGVVKRFSWPFRLRLAYTECQLAQEGSPAGTVNAAGELVLPSGKKRSLELVVGGKILFQDGTDAASATLGFDAFARADDQRGNGDGQVTLDELSLVPLHDAGVHLDPTKPEQQGWETLRDFVYCGLATQLVSLRHGTCQVRLERTEQDAGALTGRCGFQKPKGGWD